MSGAILIATLLLMVTVGWSLWDEIYGQRPWKSFQRQFVERYSSYLTKVKSKQAADAENQVKQSPEYQKLAADAAAADQATKPERDQINDQVALLTLQINAVSKPYQ